MNQGCVEHSIDSKWVELFPIKLNFYDVFDFFAFFAIKRKMSKNFFGCDLRTIVFLGHQIFFVFAFRIFFNNVFKEFQKKTRKFFCVYALKQVFLRFCGAHV